MTPTDPPPAVHLPHPVAAGPIDVGAELVAVPEQPADLPPPVVAGSFAIYEDGKGGYVVVADYGDGPTRRHIPRAMVKLFSRAGAGLLGRTDLGRFLTGG